MGSYVYRVFGSTCTNQSSWVSYLHSCDQWNASSQNVLMLWWMFG